MNSSISRRLFRTIFAISLANVIVTLVAVEFIYEDVENTILRQELARERGFFESQIVGDQAQSWQTALITALYIPDGQSNKNMPEIFRDREAPTSAEVALLDKTYLLSIERVRQPAGLLYIAQDITLMEDREDVLQVGIVILALVMLLIGFLSARVGTRLIVQPLKKLTRHIAQITPGSRFARIEKSYKDEELFKIVETLNQLLAALDTYVKREKLLVSLASHELRTPVAVIIGALDVLEQRSSLGDADAKTVARIRRAADDMRSDIEALLKLARRADPGQDETSDLDMVANVQWAIREIEQVSPEQQRRILFKSAPPFPVVRADEKLLRMLLRNLLQNAIKHTRGDILLDLAPGHLTISDQGAGLPDHVKARWQNQEDQDIPEGGLGLFIVRLICERLGWVLRIDRSGPEGTVLNLVFTNTQMTPKLKGAS